MGVSPQLRKRVSRRAGGRCEYCRAPEGVSPASFSVEHIVPRSRGGGNAPANLAFSCQGCNNHKLAAVEAVDPKTGRMAPLFHPRQQVWLEHFAWTKDGLRVEGLTPTGRATVLRLQLNRSRLVHLREVLIPVGEHPPKD